MVVVAVAVVVAVVLADNSSSSSSFEQCPASYKEKIPLILISMDGFKVSYRLRWVINSTVLYLFYYSYNVSCSRDSATSGFYHADEIFEITYTKLRSFAYDDHAVSL